jgi:exonuclease VII large subunit
MTEVTSYTELITGIKGRLAELGIRYQDFDKLAGFSDGLTGKAFGPSQVKRLGPEKLFDALRAAALRIRIEPDAQQLANLQKQITENCQVRQEKQARPNNHAHPSNKIVEDVLSYLVNKKGGLTQLNDAVKEARSKLARHAAKALWEKRRECSSTIRYLENVSPINSVRRGRETFEPPETDANAAA